LHDSGSEARGELSAAVPRAVIYDDDFERWIRLSLCRGDRIGQEALAIEHRDDDAD
jgi:hypothetical protein